MKTATMKTATMKTATLMMYVRVMNALAGALAAAPRPRCDRGAIMVEFVLLTAAVAIPVSVVFVSLGIPALRYLRYAQMALVGPIP